MSKTTEKEILETTETIIEEVAEVKPYTFRKLSSPDVFPMFKIISKIGINEFTTCFERANIKDMIASLFRKTEETEEAENENNIEMVGFSLVLEAANIILGNLPKCENDIYQILSQVSGMTVDEIKALDMAVFAEMIIDFIKKEEFKDFFKVVSKLFK